MRLNLPVQDSHARRKLRMAPAGHSHRYAFTLIEMIAYVTVLAVILFFAYMAMVRSSNSSIALRQNTTDISRALQAGERWRDDVRNTTGSARRETTGDGEVVVHLPQRQGEIVYRFTADSVLRRVDQAPWTVMLAGVKHSKVISDQRHKVTAWRWELELQTSNQKFVRMRPLFTFVGVPSEAQRK